MLVQSSWGMGTLAFRLRLRVSRRVCSIGGLGRQFCATHFGVVGSLAKSWGETVGRYAPLGSTVLVILKWSFGNRR